MKKRKRKTKPQAHCFEFYKVLDSSHIGSGKQLIVERMKRFNKKIFKTEILFHCRNKYGAGNYVALEIPCLQPGLPIGFWIIKIRTSHSKKKRINPSESELQALRTCYLISRDTPEESPLQTHGMPYYYFFEMVNNSFREIDPESFSNRMPSSAAEWQRGVEAAAMAHQLKELTEPQKLKRARDKQGGRPRSSLVAYAENLLEEKTPEKTVIDLVEKKIAESSPSNESLYNLEERALTTLGSAKKSRTRKNNANHS